jgi:protein gp37/ParB-like chromosome segregation protein Spo0J
MNRPTKELTPHPLNADIYGDAADKQLIQSIKDNGVIEPLVIDHKGRIVSGHRRWHAARELKIEELPVEVFQSHNELDIESALVESNRQRIKTNEQLAREATQIFKIEQARARIRQINANPKGALPAKSPEGVGDARDVAARRLGIGGKKVEQSAQVIEALDRLEKEEKPDEAEKLRTELNKYSVNRAHNIAREKGHLKGVNMAPPAEDDFVLIERWMSLSKEKQQATLSKPCDKSGFNFQETDGIEWARWSWNPITGCNHGCEYCYARDIANHKFKPKFAPAFYPGRLKCPEQTKLPAEAKTDIGLKNVFTCSMADLFGKWVPADLIELVLDVVRRSPQWNFLFLTKFPRRYLEFEFPDNAWVGTSVDKQGRVEEAEEVFKRVKAKIKWLSCEPLLEDLTFEHLDRFQWVVMGGASKSTRMAEFKPPREWVTHLWAQARAAGCMIYEKPNLLERCREYPTNSAHL